MPVPHPVHVVKTGCREQRVHVVESTVIVLSFESGNVDSMIHDFLEKSLEKLVSGAHPKGMYRANVYENGL